MTTAIIRARNTPKSSNIREGGKNGDPGFKFCLSSQSHPCDLSSRSQKDFKTSEPRYRFEGVFIARVGAIDIAINLELISRKFVYRYREPNATVSFTCVISAVAMVPIVTYLGVSGCFSFFKVSKLFKVNMFSS